MTLHFRCHRRVSNVREIQNNFIVCTNLKEKKNFEIKSIDKFLNKRLRRQRYSNPGPQAPQAGILPNYHEGVTYFGMYF